MIAKKETKKKSLNRILPMTYEKRKEQEESAQTFRYPLNTFAVQSYLSCPNIS